MDDKPNGRPTYQWITNLLITVLGAILLTAVGWMKTYLDALDAKVADINTKMAVVQGTGTGVIELDVQVAKLQSDVGLLNYKIEQLLKTNEGLVSKVADQQRTLDIQADWIAAHAYADKAIRELHTPRR